MPDAETLFVSFCLGLVLLRISLVDLRELRVPDALSLPLIIIGLAIAYASSPLPLIDHAVGAIAAFSTFWLIGEVFFRLRGTDGLGLGDAKLFAGAGAWCAWQALPWILLLAALLGLGSAIVMCHLGYRDPRIPFAPALSAAFWLVWVTMQQV